MAGGAHERCQQLVSDPFLPVVSGTGIADKCQVDHSLRGLGARGRAGLESRFGCGNDPGMDDRFRCGDHLGSDESVARRGR